MCFRLCVLLFCFWSYSNKTTRIDVQVHLALLSLGPLTGGLRPCLSEVGLSTPCHWTLTCTLPFMTWFCSRFHVRRLFSDVRGLLAAAAPHGREGCERAWAVVGTTSSVCAEQGSPAVSRQVTPPVSTACHQHRALQTRVAPPWLLPTPATGNAQCSVVEHTHPRPVHPRLRGRARRRA